MSRKLKVVPMQAPIGVLSSLANSSNYARIFLTKEQQPLKIEGLSLLVQTEPHKYGHSIKIKLKVLISIHMTLISTFFIWISK